MSLTAVGPAVFDRLLDPAVDVEWHRNGRPGFPVLGSETRPARLVLSGPQLHCAADVDTTPLESIFDTSGVGPDYRSRAGLARGRACD